MTLLRKKPWEPVRPESISNRIVNQVIDALFAKKLRPGDFFGTEAQLAESFQASRLPVREALGRLESLGVVNIKTGAGGGATIAEGEPTQFAIALAVQFTLVGVTTKELFNARIAIECMAAELAAQNATKEDIKRLRTLLEEAETKKEGGPDTIESLLKFHLALVEASQTRTLTALMHALMHLLLNTYLEISPPPGRSPSGFKALKSILDHIEKGDAWKANLLMREHLIWQRDTVIERLGEEGTDSGGEAPQEVTTGS